ncbi:MAG: hypothetical protein MMC23_006910 [Stictis urceolatum]|nr:hypothetical protein [Stictis urceolata]
MPQKVPISQSKRRLRADAPRQPTQSSKDKGFKPNSTVKGNANALTSTLKSQQRLLDIFSSSFPEILQGDIDEVIQTIKGHLYNRDFAKAFGSEEFLQAYAVRWSPTRALGYQQLLSALFEEELKDALAVPTRENTVGNELGGLSLEDEDRTDASGRARGAGLQILCMGGGAGAELVAFAGALSSWLEKHPTQNKSHSVSDAQASSSKETGNPTLSLKLLDIADWATVTKKLFAGITARPEVSEYASTAVKAGSKSLLESGQLDATFEQADILGLSKEQLATLTRDCGLVTLLFTLNELYTTSIPKTTGMLLMLTKVLPPGALLLVVDSPGSYSKVEIGKEKQDAREKKYPMHWLLDHTLLEAAQGDKREVKWRKIQEQESRWFRLYQDLRYPLVLEDMRYQLHFYRRV